MMCTSCGGRHKIHSQPQMGHYGPGFPSVLGCVRHDLKCDFEIHLDRDAHIVFQRQYMEWCLRAFEFKLQIGEGAHQMGEIRFVGYLLVIFYTSYTVNPFRHSIFNHTADQIKNCIANFMPYHTCSTKTHLNRAQRESYLHTKNLMADARQMANYSHADAQEKHKRRALLD